jgi:CubicO group peptidase (beta-lactamase class C family)
MKKKSIILTILITPIVLSVIFLAVLSIQFTPIYVFRLITMNVPDVYDYQLFENRNIKGADEVFSFEEAIDGEYIESLFSDRLEWSGFDDFDEWAEQSQTTSLIVIRKDKILYEKYFNGFTRDSFFHSQSMAKSFISFLVGAAIDDGVINGVDDPMTQYIPELAVRDPRFAKITIKDLLEMRSGLRYFEGYFPGTYIHLPWHDEAVGYYHNNVRNLLLNRVKIDREPGTDFQYNNYNTSYLGLILERATGKTVSEYLEEKLWSRIMEYDALFSIDSKKSGFEYMPSRLMARAIDFARFGRLYLNKGIWEGEEIISASWIEQSVTENPGIPRDIYPEWFGGEKCDRTFYNYQWWGHKNCDSAGQFFASGNLGQSIYVIPDLEIVIVHTGNSLEHYGDYDLWHIASILREDEK